MSIQPLIDRNNASPLGKQMEKVLARIGGPTKQLDDWAAAELRDYRPQVFAALLTDIEGADGRVFALHDRVMARRENLMRILGQLHLRLLQVDLQMSGRKINKELIQATTHVEGSAQEATAMRLAAAAFGSANVPLAEGLRLHAEASAVADDSLGASELARRNALVEQAKLQEEHDDAVNALHELERGPFDFDGQFGRQQKIYLNDLRSFVDALHQFVMTLGHHGITSEATPDYRDPAFVWEAGEFIQRLSRGLFRYRATRTTRLVAISVGWMDWNTNETGHCRFLGMGAGVAEGEPLTPKQYCDLLEPQPRQPNQDLQQPAPPPWQVGAAHPVRPDWARLRFALHDDEGFRRVAGDLHPGHDARVQAIGAQWIITTPYLDEGDSEDAVKVNRIRESKSRNMRGIVVPTILRLPKKAGFATAEAAFPTACTTDDPIDRVIAARDPVITGRQPFGLWEVDVGTPTRRGKKQERLLNRAGRTISNELAFPSLIGLVLHLSVSIRREE